MFYVILFPASNGVVDSAHKILLFILFTKIRILQFQGCIVAFWPVKWLAGVVFSPEQLICSHLQDKAVVRNSCIFLEF